MQNTKALNSIIRSSLSAASAALEMLDIEDAPAVVEVGCRAAVMPACESYSAVIAEATDSYSSKPEFDAVEVSPFVKLMQELEDPRYKLRTYAELAVKTGITVGRVEDELLDNGVDYVTRVRRSDGANLIGLASRN